MPAVLEYTPPTSNVRNQFQQEVVKERQVREKTYKTALKYYLGEHDAMLKFDKDINDVNDNVVINMVKMTADRTSTFLFPKVPSIELDPKSIERTEEEIWVDKFLEFNGGLKLLTKWVLRGFLAGHTFIRVRPKRTSAYRETYPRISLLDPLSVTIYWSVNDPEEVVWYEVRTLTGEQVHIYDYVHNLETDTWTIYHYASLKKPLNPLDNIVETITQQAYSDYKGALDRIVFGDDGWSLEDVDEFPDIGIPPIIETAHLPHPTGRYGSHEVGLKELQDTINLVASLRNSVARESGVPIDVILGAGIGDVDNKEDIWVVDNPNAKVERLQLKGDVMSLNNMLETLMETYLSISRVVLLKGEAKDLQRVTNAAVRTLFLDQIAKNGVLQSAYGNSLKQIIKMGLKMSELSTAGADHEVMIKFPNALPTDYSELANQLAIIHSMGAVSKRTVATEMGMNWEFERATMQTEHEDDMNRQKAQMELMQSMQPEQDNQQQDNQQQQANQQNNSN